MTELRLYYEGPANAGRTTSMAAVRSILAHSYDVTGAWDQLVLTGPGITIDATSGAGAAFDDPVRDERSGRARVYIVVLDSQPERLEANREVLADIASRPVRPLVLQFNKRDLHSALPFDELQRELNPHAFPAFESIATRGVGTMEAFHTAAILAAKLAGCSDELHAMLAAAPNRTS